jgi:hypothetical protein
LDRSTGARSTAHPTAAWMAALWQYIIKHFHQQRLLQSHGSLEPFERWPLLPVKGGLLRALASPSVVLP